MSKLFRLSCIVALIAAFAPSLHARSSSYSYRDTAEGRVYTADVAETDQFIAAIRADATMWRKHSATVTVLSLRPVATDAPATGPHVIIGANAQWVSDLYLLNSTAATVVQKVGHRTFTAPGLDPIIFEPTITLQPTSWTIVKAIGKNFDSDWHQYSATSPPGLYGLQIDTHLQAAVYNSFSDGIAKFELPAMTKWLTSAAGQTLSFVLVRTDLSPHVGAYPTVLNTNSGNVGYELRVCTQVSDCLIEVNTAAPGVSQVGIRRVCDTACSVQFCLLSCSVGAPLALPGGVYPFIAIGDGGTQVARLPN